MTASPSSGTGRSASKRLGLRVYARASSPTSPSSVAEKSIVWRFAGSAAQDLLDLRAEAHVEHPVGLVEHEDRDVLDRDEAAVHQVLQPARRGDDDLRALRGLRLLAATGAPP